MDWVQAVVLALVQGLTEFLPISSSAHLILVPKILGWPDQGLAFDVAIHVGTLTAVVIYFRGEVLHMTMSWARSLKTRQADRDAKLAWAVILGTIPVGLAGLLFKGVVEDHLRSPLVIAIMTIAFGVVLWWAWVAGKRQRSEYEMSWKDVMLVGVFQALALIPGTSRSGATITAGLLLNLTPTAAARFSFLLSIPVIVLSGLMAIKDMVEAEAAVDWAMVLLGVGLSAVSAYLCIHFFLRLLERVGMLPFVVYRLLLGVVLFVLFTD